MEEIYNSNLHDLIEICRKKNLNICTAESCTGGMIATALTSLPGSSEYFQGGVVVYSNTSKSGVLNIPSQLIKKKGAVSTEVATAMARRVIELIPADISISVTGIAGPTGGSREKPVGTIFISCYFKSEFQTWRIQLQGDRTNIRRQVVEIALEKIMHIAQTL